jgi:hypothetical protein
MGHFTPDRYKKLSPLLPDEPTFTIRAKDNFSVAVLRLLQNVYHIDEKVIKWFTDWRRDHPQDCKDPDDDNILEDNKNR